MSRPEQQNQLEAARERIVELESLLASSAQETDFAHDPEGCYSLLLETSPDGIVILSLTRKILLCNRVALRMSGYDSMDELRGRDGLLMVAPGDRERLLFHTSKLKRAEVVLTDEVFCVRKNGSRFPAELSASSLRNGKGEPAAIIIFIHSLEQHRRDRTALKRSEALYRAIFETSPDGIAIFRPDGRLYMSNQRAATILGFQEFEELLGRRYADLVLPSTGEKLDDEFRDCMTRSVRNREHMLLRKDGSQFPAEISSSPIRNGEGRAVGFLAVFRDISGRRQGEEALRRSEARYRTLFETSPDGIGILDLNGKIVMCNGKVAQLHGYEKPEEVIGKNAFDMVASEDRLRLQKQIERGMRKPRDSTGKIQLSVIRADGTLHPAEISGTIMHDDLGRPSGVLAVLRDIADRRQIEKRLTEARQAIDGIVNAIAQTVESRDPYTAGHEQRVSDLAEAIAKEMGLAKETIEGIRLAGAIHDLGKIHVPAEILTKPGALSEYEVDFIQSHCQTGYEILKNIEFPWPLAQVVLQHHEKLDGSGYPKGLKDGEILVEARILSVADTVEAMASHRPYRPSLGIDAALAEIGNGNGTLYDPEAVKACRRLFLEKGYQLTDGYGN